MPYVDGKYMPLREWQAKFGRLKTLTRVDTDPVGEAQEEARAQAEPASVAKRKRGASRAASKATGLPLNSKGYALGKVEEVPGGEPVNGKVALADTVSPHLNDTDPVEVDENGNVIV